MRLCSSIGTDLLAVEYDDKDTCIAKFTRSNFIFVSRVLIFELPLCQIEHKAVRNLDFWTSGSQKECPGKMSWCSLERPMRNRNLSWASSSDGDCVSVKYGPNATSTFTKTSCEKQLAFICEVKCHFFYFELLKIQNICRFTTMERLVRRCSKSACKCGTFQLV